MVTENTNPFAALLPDRHPQHDLFICDVADAVLKDVMQHMEHPFYSLSKKPETTVKRYRNGDHWLEITPSIKGLATIYDKDILIYCISQIMAKLKRGEEVSPRVRINSHELLIFTNRGTSGREYMSLMVKDHQQDVAEYDRMSQQADNPDLKNYASSTSPTLREHLRQAREIAHKVGAK